MYQIIDKQTGYIVDVTTVDSETRRVLEECGFICRKVK